MTDATIELLVRRARIAAADPARSMSPAIAAMAAGAGAELVARAQLASEVLECRTGRWADMSEGERRALMQTRLASLPRVIGQGPA